MPKEKRTKPCFNCKESKVKCIYNGSLPCERCIKNGQSSTCHFALKLPSLKVPSISTTVTATTTATPQPTPEVGRLPPFNGTIPPINGQLPGIPSANTYMVPSSYSAYNQQQQQDTAWKSQIENRMNTFDNKINELVDILRVNQQFIMDNQQKMYQQYHHQYQPIPILSQNQDTYVLEGNSRPELISPPPIPSHVFPNQLREVDVRSSDGISSSSSWRPIRQPPAIESQPLATAHHPVNTSSQHRKRRASKCDDTSESHTKRPLKESGSHPKDFREGFLSKEEANDLFKFFDANISQQLFGFEISKFSTDSLWDTCPVLVCAICTIASIHHSSLSWKSKQLSTYLHELCSSLLFKGKPKDENEGFNTILALILCSFWLSDSQMFTGLALQLAKEYGLNDPHTENKDRLKLWYLLYVLDGQQSLTFNRQPLVNPQDYSLMHSKEILLTKRHKKLPHGHKKKLLKSKEALPKQDNITEVDLDEMAKKQRFTDMRLVSQVEYNQALNEAKFPLRTSNNHGSSKP
ncbi:uncharacterized protein J8A68_000391 [[Candida] subhashii]|uniref:Zn(2)-C6 fungal-type domain-containing protein n=1 Tax=[Candida] subhashii TaxID=561895 RepID=A0A8J5QIA9_9ASCO|nr:uncharacterized protein J8A68_000391 [[Candida] subhashii]KAG7666134.1 hypothetical protein J8A68_000391 [[Candida] subhashii]